MMQQLLDEPYWVYAVIFFAGLVAYVISTLSGGGGSLLLVPVISFFIGGKTTAPVLGLGNLMGEPIRLFLFWKYIEWRVVKYYLPAAIAGAAVGALIFANIKLEWLQIIVGLFLISTIFQYRFGKKERSFKMKLGWFIPLGFVVALFSSVVGATGPVLNSFYLNIGLEKEKMIATKTFKAFFAGLVQVSSYTALGTLKGNLWTYGIILGLGASAGNWIGKTCLKKLSGTLFRKLVIGVMAISGVIMIIKQIMAQT